MRLISVRRVLVTVLVVGACKSNHDPTPHPAAVGGSAVRAQLADAKSGAVPHTTGPIVIDGDLKEEDWHKHMLRFQFHQTDGDLARPYSEVRFVHDDETLYIALYAADINIQSDDAFDVTVGPTSLHITATGQVTPDSPDVRVAVDRDGTLDDPKDHDEEWKLEVAIPLTKTGLEPGKTVEARTARCDIPKDGVKRCGEWTGTLTLE
jgi:hypothetical protein